MIDFQNDGLESQVFELISRMCDLYQSDEFPHFKLSKTETNRWQCELAIDGIEKPVIAYGDTEVAAINRCASKMLYILEHDHSKGQYDPDSGDNPFLDQIEIYFHGVELNRDYIYYPFHIDITVNPDSELAKGLTKCAQDSLRRSMEKNEFVDRMSSTVTVRFLIKRKKKIN